MIHLIIYFFVLFVFAQYYSFCLFNSVLLCKVSDEHTISFKQRGL